LVLPRVFRWLRDAIGSMRVASSLAARLIQ
jgi:hypothetical protein